MKVLFITRKWPPAVGGMETYCREFTRELKDISSVEIACLPGRADGSPPGFIEMLGFALRTSWRLLLYPRDYDVIHGADLAIWPLVWIALFRNGHARSLLSAHGTDIAYAFRSGFPARVYRRYLGMALRLLPRTTVVANSLATARLCEQVGFRSVRIVRLGARTSSRVKADHKPYLLFLGRLIPRKGCAWFIHEVLPRVDSDLRLVVAGTIWDADEGSAIKDPRVEFLGPVAPEERERLCAEATAVVVPNLDLGISGFEGFGLSATEAAAAGAVVLASRIDGLVDAVRDRVSGFLLPAGEPDAWAEKILEIQNWSEAERAFFLERSLQHIADHYSWKNVARETMDAYSSGDGMPVWGDTS